MSNEIKLYTIKEIAQEYGITTMAIRHWMKQGCPFEWEKTRTIGVKRRILLDKIKVEEWLKSK